MQIAQDNGTESKPMRIHRVLSTLGFHKHVIHVRDSNRVETGDFKTIMTDMYALELSNHNIIVTRHCGGSSPMNHVHMQRGRSPM